MLETFATAVVTLFAVYAALGLAFAVPFLWWGAGRIDPAARRASLGFRLIAVPGTVALWPILAWRWRRAPEVEE